jgi:hypothetical protein
VLLLPSINPYFGVALYHFQQLLCDTQLSAAYPELQWFAHMLVQGFSFAVYLVLQASWGAAPATGGARIWRC